MYDLPEPPAATTAGQATDTSSLQDAILQAAVRDALHQTSYRDTTPVPQHGTTPPVSQPGRPAMSQRATDASVMMIAGGFLSLCLGAAISGVLYFSGTANETVVIAVCAAPPTAFLSLKALFKGIKRAVTPDIHVHNGPEYHQTRIDQRRAIWQKDLTKR